LRGGKMKNLRSVVDLKWHPTELNIIASAPTNGSIIIWDIKEKQAKMSISKTFKL
jgi:WD40 repeat protein